MTITEVGSSFLKEINGTLTWETTSTLGTIYTDEISDLYIKANLSPAIEKLKYKISSGNLPTGLILFQDGTIQGKLWNDFIPEGVVSQTFNFTADAYVNYSNVISQENFSINVVRTTSTNYTSIFSTPLQKLNDRTEINAILNNPDIFDQRFIYRPYDNYFGVQKQLKLIVEFSAERSEKNDYYTLLTQNFSRKKLVLGNLNTAVYKKNNSTVYELIYIEVIDNLINNKGISVSKEFNYNNQNIYPPSILNMKDRIQTSFNSSTGQIPGFFKTENITYKLFVPLCYCLPNKSKLILSKLKNKNIKFNNIDFDVDRLVIEQLSDTIYYNLSGYKSVYYRFKT